MDSNESNSSSHYDSDSSTVVTVNNYSYIDINDLYKIYLTVSDTKRDVIIEFLKTIPVAKNHTQTITLLQNLGTVTIDYPGVTIGTEIHSSNETEQVTIMINDNQDPSYDLYNALFHIDPQGANELLTSETQIKYLPYINYNLTLNPYNSYYEITQTPFLYPMVCAIWTVSPSKISDLTDIKYYTDFLGDNNSLNE